MGYKWFIIGLLLLTTSVQAQQKITISGQVREKGSGESLIGVNVYIPSMQVGTVTNTYGFYSLTITTDSAEVIFSYVGYEPVRHIIKPGMNPKIDVELNQSISLNEVVITADKPEKISDIAEMSTISVPVIQIKTLPTLLGEKDVMKILQLMPGVQKGTEGSSGIYVRGGGPDQNLIILDDAPVYNANHLFGFFSLFNGDALKSVELIKGGFPARYGGRLSSVIEMNMKDGNLEKYSGEAGIGIISSRLTLEGPIVKNRSSFLISGRRTYVDILMKPFMPDDMGSSGYYFYDFNAKANYKINDKDRVYLSGYFGRDKFYFSDNANNTDQFKAGLFWQNSTATARWNHIFNDKLFANTSVIYSRYKMEIYEKDEFDNGTFSLTYNSGISDLALKYDLMFLPSPVHTIRMGMSSTYHRFKPSAVVIEDTGNNEFTSEINLLEAYESGIYAEDEWKWNRLRGNIGFRLSHYNYREKNYFRPEPRATIAYLINESSSFKASYAMMNQYVHLLSNTGLGLPTDLWVPSTNHINPQQSQQFAIGYARDLEKPNLTLTLEAYYKESVNVLGYREGASFMLIDDPSGAEQMSWENNVTAGKGSSYGLEILLQRKFGKFSGWIGYTLSWTWLQFDELNSGEKFFAKYDRRHDLSVVGIYKFNERVTLSGVWVFASGNAISLPTETYDAYINSPNYNNYFNYSYYATNYGPKNSFRMKAYHRLDVGVQFHKKLKRGERTFEISFYNFYNRKNAFFYYIGDEQTFQGNYKTVLKQVSLFPIIPSISYTFKF